MSNFQLWRIHLRPADRSTQGADEFCITNNILGFGWPLELRETVADLDEYWAGAERQYITEVPEGGYRSKSWRSAINALYWRMQVNDLVWTRTREGIYYLGRITGEWQYLADEDHRKVDICNFRSCEWLEVGTVDRVAGRIVNSLIRGRTLQQIKSESMRNFSRFLWNRVGASSHQYVLPRQRQDSDILELVSAEDCEDALGLYLQKRSGFAVIPGTCKSDTAAYEYVLTHRERKERAVVQVKQGTKDVLRATDYLELSKDNEVFLFSTGGNYDRNGENERIHFIDPNDIRTFLMEEEDFVGDRIATWLAWIQAMRNGCHSSVD